MAERAVSVPAEGEMDDETFVKHMNLRHHDSLGGLSQLVFQWISPYVLECYRKFHHQLHAVRIDLDHEHNT